MTHALQIQTSMPRAGRRFEPTKERELHGEALSAASALQGASRGLIVVPEFTGPLGIPDFTAFVGEVDMIKTRQALAVPPIVNEIDAGVLAAAHIRRPSTPEALAATLGWPVQTISGRIRRLVAVGALVEITRGRYVRRAEIQANGRLYAIEAKIEDWRSALRQARTYRVWADGYVLVMTSLSDRTRAELASEVEKDQGGLVVDGIWVLRPRVAPVSPHRRVQAAELFAAATRLGLYDPTLATRINP